MNPTLIEQRLHAEAEQKFNDQLSELIDGVLTFVNERGGDAHQRVSVDVDDPANQASVAGLLRQLKAAVTAAALDAAKRRAVDTFLGHFSAFVEKRDVHGEFFAERALGIVIPADKAPTPKTKKKPTAAAPQE